MSRLTWNEIRSKANAFAKDWENCGYEKGDTQTFYNEFFEIFGMSRKRVASFETPVKKLGEKQGFIDLFWKGVLLIEQKSQGRNLAHAKQQALDYFPGLKDEELPRYVLACDFQTFELYDLETNEEAKFSLKDLPKHINKFSFILGVEKRTFKDQDPVNIKASVLMGRLHDALYDSGYRGHDLERFLVRLLFCLFADDTGIFEPRDQFDELIRTRTKPDGSDVGPLIALLFQVLNTDIPDREKQLDSDLANFPYVNGDLFAESLRLPSFNAAMRSLLLEACEFSWDAISPAIFGALFQHVSGDAAARRAQGEHYTSEGHIMRLIGPLFVDDLRAELSAILARKGAGRVSSLQSFRSKLARLTFFDPACGCGNFLIITYRELRKLETEALKAEYENKPLQMDASAFSTVDVNQFYGIEMNEFPARIAEVAMWMMDHIMNNALSIEMGQNYARIPLKKSPKIWHVDALEADWAELLPAENCNYVLGNPPFLGAKYQTDTQREHVRKIVNLGKSGGTLDFVCAWYYKAAKYVQGHDTQIAFVSTNSITQGEQVGQFWPALFAEYGLEISFAHRTFEWYSNAKGKAHVHVVILGLTPRHLEPKSKRLFSYEKINGDPMESRHTKLSPYLIDASRLNNPYAVVREEPRPINGAQRVVAGTQPIDGGFYIFTEQERMDFLAVEPESEVLMRKFVGSEELINGSHRYILDLKGASPSVLRSLPYVRKRIESVAEFRRLSKRAATIQVADTPSEFFIRVVPETDFLAIPETSSENREYIPIGYLAAGTVPSNLLKVVVNPDPWYFAVLTSRMHMAWMRLVAGRLTSRYRYGIGTVYNTFPWPEASDQHKTKIGLLGQSVLDARAEFPTSSLEDLYDSVTMPVKLRKAHQALDAAVDKLYSPTGFTSDVFRAEHLLNLYSERTATLFSESSPKKRRKPKA